MNCASGLSDISVTPLYVLRLPLFVLRNICGIFRKPYLDEHTPSFEIDSYNGDIPPVGFYHDLLVSMRIWNQLKRDLRTADGRKL